jgi:hypothetical protein
MTTAYARAAQISTAPTPRKQRSFANEVKACIETQPFEIYEEPDGASQ